MMLQEVDADVWLQVFGRFHIVLLHLPIGLIPAMAVLEIGAALFRRTLPRGALLTLAVLTALTAGATLASGLVLADEKVDSETLWLHKVFAIAMSSVCVLLPFLAVRQGRRAFRLVLVASLTLSVVTGHYGGTLTHRADFLLGPLERALAQQDAPPSQGDTSAQSGAPTQEDPPEQVPPEQVPPAQGEATNQPEPPVRAAELPDVVTYAQHIAPVLKRTCTSCHNKDDYEGDLDLSTYALVVGAGYEDDPYVVASKPDESYLVEVCELPADDEMHMPPEDEPQLTKAEIALLRRWIATGCKE